MPKSKIITDPAKWPTSTYNHIFREQDINPPEAALKDTLVQWGKRRLRVDPFLNWWKDLSGFSSLLKGWKLAGHGTQPNTVLHPGEKPHKGDTKLSSADIAAAVFGDEDLI